MKSSHAIRILLPVTLLLAGLLVLRFMLGDPDRIPGSQAPDTGLGIGLADEVVALTGGEGDIVILTADPSRDSLAIQTLTGALAKTPGIRIVATETLAGRFTDWPESDPLPPEDFLELMSTYNTATLVVSFVGVPVLTTAQVRRLPPPGQPGILIVYPAYYEPAPVWMDTGRVGAVIMPRRNPPILTDVMPSTPREWFDREFQVAHRNDDLAE